MSERITRPKYTEAEIFTPQGELEGYLLGLVDENSLFSYDALPAEIKSETIERYANWFGAVAAESDNYDEVGAYIHVRREPLKLILPVRPDVGQGEVTPPFTRNRTNVVPVAFVHNHPTNGAFSQPPGHDMNCVINGYEDKGDNIQVPVWVLSTPDDNYLLLQTKETQPQDNFELYKMSYNAKENSHFYDFRRYGAPSARAMSRDDFFNLFSRLEKQAFGQKNGLHAFYGSMYGTFAIAEECKLGFYHSYKDGNYQRVTPDMLDQLVALRYEQALQKALKAA